MDGWRDSFILKSIVLRCERFWRQSGCLPACSGATTTMAPAKLGVSTFLCISGRVYQQIGLASSVHALDQTVLIGFGHSPQHPYASTRQTL
jgi:hypothetical protein